MYFEDGAAGADGGNFGAGKKKMERIANAFITLKTQDTVDIEDIEVCSDLVKKILKSITNVFITLNTQVMLNVENMESMANIQVFT